MQQKWDQGTLGRRRLTLIGSRTRLGPSMDPAMAQQYTWHGPLYMGYIFAFYATKMGSKDFGETKVNLIGSRTHLRPSMDPTMALQYTKHGPLYIGYIFAFYATKMGSRDSGHTKVNPHWVLDPPWSFNGPCQGPTIHVTWSFIYGLYFCILCKKLIKGLWRHKDWPPLDLGPALVLQWTLPWP